MVSDYNVNAEIWQVVKTMENKRQQVMMAVLPPFVNYSLVNTMLEPLYAGFTTVLLPKYEPEKFAEYVTKYRVNHVNSIPAYWEALLTIPNIQKYYLSGLGFVFYGGEGMPKDKEEKVNEVLASCGAKVKLQKGLGMTELTSAATATFESVNATSTGIVGIPLAKMIVKAVDVDDGAEKTYGEEGELCITGPTVMLGYYHNKSATDDLIKTDDDGVRWIHTGDLGRINQDGVVRITGRVKRIIMTKGSDGQVTKMFPNRIEKAVHTDDSVGLCCVVGVPDEQRINVPKAYIVLNPGFEKTEETKQKIIQNCKKMLPGYMVPEEIEFRDSLPRTPRGKIDYRALENETQASK
jgi:long-chain acyl-CoA synthetase